MSYASAPATSPVTLLDAFVAFLTAAGWTQDAYVADGTGKRYHGHKGAKYIHLRSFINEAALQLGTGSAADSGIAVMGSTGYTGIVGPWYAQAGQPVTLGGSAATAITCVMSLPPGAVSASWMFASASGDCCALVAPNAAGIYTYVYFGDIVKPQAWTGGMYFGGSRPRSGVFGGFATQESGPPGDYALLRADVDSFVGLWTTIDQALATGKVLQSTVRAINRPVDFPSQHISYGEFRKRARSAMTNGLLLLPTILLVERDFGGALSGGGFSIAGQIPDVFQTTSTGTTPGSPFVIGPDTYVVFPEFAIKKNP